MPFLIGYRKEIYFLMARQTLQQMNSSSSCYNIPPVSVLIDPVSAIKNYI